MPKTELATAKGNPADIDFAFSFSPDWSVSLTADQAETEMKAFKFEGVGWYILKNLDTVLVHLVPGAEPGYYQFEVWNGRNPADALNWMINAPTRRDER
jgi:hypothetical protein